jgi:AraC-like DNA-binding protein
MAKSKEPAPQPPAYLDQYAITADPLSRITDQVRLTNLFSGAFRVTLPFVCTVRDEGFHLVVPIHGALFVEALDSASFDPTLVQVGELAMMPQGIPHRYLYPLDAPRDREATLTHVLDQSQAAPGEVEFLGMIGYFDRAHRNLLSDFLPPIIHLKKETTGLAPWLNRTIDLCREEQRMRSAGHRSIVTRLVEVMYVQALRMWIEHLPPEQKGWLRGLKDPQLALALDAIHDNPGFRWTVEALAREARMSRTVFAERFKTVIGEPPMDYVARWRMHCAVGLLERGEASLKSVAAAFGYKSRTSFRSNFKRQFGVLPSDYRKR